MGRKKNRCSVKSCNIVIKDGYTHCYMHRHCRARVLDVQAPDSPMINIPFYRKFYCEECGTNSYNKHYIESCPYCGRLTEEVT